MPLVNDSVAVAALLGRVARGPEVVRRSLLAVFQLPEKRALLWSYGTTVRAAAGPPRRRCLRRRDTHAEVVVGSSRSGEHAGRLGGRSAPRRPSARSRSSCTPRRRPRRPEMASDPAHETRNVRSLAGQHRERRSRELQPSARTCRRLKSSCPSRASWSRRLCRDRSAWTCPSGRRWGRCTSSTRSEKPQRSTGSCGSALGRERHGRSRDVPAVLAVGSRGSDLGSGLQHRRRHASPCRARPDVRRRVERTNLVAGR